MGNLNEVITNLEAKLKRLEKKDDGTLKHLVVTAELLIAIGEVKDMRRKVKYLKEKYGV